MSDSLSVDAEKNYLPGGFTAWLVCISGGLFFFYEFFQLNLFDVINQSLRDAFQLDAAQLSYLSSSYLWANILFLLPAGIILDRFSVRRVILTTMGICIIGTFGFAFSHSFAWASFFHFLPGIGNAFCFLSALILISRWFPSHQQAFVVGCVVTLAFLGGMTAHTPFVLLNESVGWRNALQIDGLIGFCIFTLLYFVIKDSPNPANIAQNEAQPILPTFIKALMNRQTLLPGVYTACLNLPIMVLGALWGASYIQGEHHLSALVASKIISTVFLGSIIGCPLAGWLSDKHRKRKPVMVFGALATLVTLIPLLLHLTLSVTTLYCIFFALGFFTSTQVISYPLIAESNQPEVTGAATGIASVIIMGGAAIGQVLFGLILQYSTLSTAVVKSDFQLALLLFPITTIFALIALFFTRETYCENTSQGNQHRIN